MDRCDGDRELLENHGEYNDMIPRASRRGVPPADQLLCRRERFAHELRALAAVALEGRRTAGRAKTDVEIMAKLFLRIKDSMPATAAPSPIRS